jgi:hypothetical protein
MPKRGMMPSRSQAVLKAGQLRDVLWSVRAARPTRCFANSEAIRAGLMSREPQGERQECR